MTILSAVIGRGATGAKPAAGSAGRLYYDTTLGKLQRDSGVAWEDVEGAVTSTINFIIDGGGVAITTGIKGDIILDYACEIVSATLLADQTGSIVIDIWKTTYAAFEEGVHPVDADSITAAAPPTLAAAVKSRDTTLAGWTTAIAAEDVLRFNVDSAATITRVTLALEVERV